MEVVIILAGGLLITGFLFSPILNEIKKMNLNVRLSALATDYIQNNRGKLSIANYVDTLLTKLATSENINAFINELNQLNNFDTYYVEEKNDINKNP